MASTLEDPQYITKVVVTGDVVLTMFKGEAWNGGSVLTGYVCTGTSVWVFTGEVLVISDLVVGTPAGFSVPLVLQQVFSPLPTASQMVTAKAPPLPPVFLCISPQDQTVVVEVASIPANASFAYTTSIVCGASFQQSASVSQFMPWMFVEGLQQAKNARSARCDKCLSAGVYGFSSPDGFMISSLTLEFEYLVDGCPQDGNVSMGIGIGRIVVHSRVLVDNPSGSACGGHDFKFGFGALNATGLLLRLRLALRLPFTCRAAGHSC